MSAQEYLFIGGASDGCTIRIPAAFSAANAPRRTGGTTVEEIYTKRVAQCGQTRTFYFALVGLSDADAFARFCKKKGISP